jgi:hypothetical protein
MSRLYMRTSKEAHLYMDQRPCTCGDIAFDRQSAVMTEGAVLCSRYFGKCRTCSTMREFVFELPKVQRPIGNELEFGGPDPSRLLDPGEWLAISEHHAKLNPGTPDDLDIARAALEEVIKFLPDGAECVPDDMFWSDRGRAVRGREPGRFRRDRLAAILEAYCNALAKQDLTQMAVAWKHTGDAEFPYTADVRQRRYTIRINDFPAEPLYTLTSDGNELQDLEDWPPAWVMPTPPKALLDTLAQKAALRHGGSVRLAATSERGETVESLALDGNEVVAGSSRRLDLATLEERPSKPLQRPAHARIVLEGGDQERILALAPEQGVAITSFVSKRGDEVRLHALRTGKRHELAVGQRKMVAAGVSPNGKCAIVLDEEGRVLCYDLATLAYPCSARARKPQHGKRASIQVARGGRLWLASAGASIEVRMMSDEKAVATVDLTPLGDEVTSAIFLPDGSGFLAGTAQGVVMRFELLLDRVGPSREARNAAIADAVDASIAGTRWSRYAPRVDVYDERSENGRTTLYFVADHYEYHHAQSGSDWAEHYLCAGHATFAGDRRVEVQVASTERRRITEREDETYDSSAELAALRAATSRARSSSTLLPGADAIKRVFDEHFASYRMALPEECLHRTAGEFEDNGWDVRYRFGEEQGTVYLDVYATNRKTNDRLYRVYADGRVDTVGASTEGLLENEDREFSAEVQRRFGPWPAVY